MDDLISRREAIDALKETDEVGVCWKGGYEQRRNDFREAIETIEDLPSAQPERLTDDDIETIRIHLSAYKEKLCNQHRWKEAEEYQRIIDRFIAFASAQQWIPVTKRLPGYGEDVLVSIGGYCNVGHIVPTNDEKQYNWYYSGWYHDPYDVDAWMPLPTPFREGGET